MVHTYTIHRIGNKNIINWNFLPKLNICFVQKIEIIEEKQLDNIKKKL